MIINSKSLMPLLNINAKIVSRSSYFPEVLVNVKNNSIEFITRNFNSFVKTELLTDWNIWNKTKIQSKSFYINLKIFQSIAKRYEQLDFQFENENIKINDFLISKGEHDFSFPEASVKIGFIQSLNPLKKILPFIEDDAVRKQISGMFFESLNNMIRFTGTNGCVLSRLEIKEKTNKNCSVLIHPEFASVINSVNHISDWNIFKSDKYVIFDSGPICIASSVMDEQYPNVESVIPSKDKFVGTLKIKKSNLNDIIIDVIEIVKPYNNTFSVLLSDSIKTDARSDDVSWEKVIEGNYEGEPLTIKLNANYVHEILKCFDTDVEIHFTGNKSAMIWKDSPDHFILLMPIWGE